MSHNSYKPFKIQTLKQQIIEILPRSGCFWPLNVQLGVLELQCQFLTHIQALTTIFLFEIPKRMLKKSPNIL